MAALRWRSDGLCVYRHRIVTAADISGWVHRLTQRRDPIRDWYFSAMCANAFFSSGVVGLSCEEM